VSRRKKRAGIGQNGALVGVENGSQLMLCATPQRLPRVMSSETRGENQCGRRRVQAGIAPAILPNWARSAPRKRPRLPHVV